jgi:hypothetical protein
LDLIFFKNIIIFEKYLRGKPWKGQKADETKKLAYTFCAFPYGVNVSYPERTSF